jgi:hypothetical protein
MTEFEAGVRELVARLRDFERRMKKTEDDAGALDQMVMMITPGLGFGAAGVPPPNTTVFGSVTGCANQGIDASLTFKVTATGDVLWTGSTPNGTYSVSFYLASNTACTLDAVPASGHLVAGSFSLGTLTAGTGNSIPTKVCSIAAGCHCFAGCATPFNATINCFDRHYSVNVTLTWNGTDRWSGTSGGRTYAVFAGGSGLFDGYAMGRGGGACTPNYRMPVGSGFPNYVAGDQFDITDNP